MSIDYYARQAEQWESNASEAEAREEALEARVDAAVALIRKVMTEAHDPCDGDCWYACPKSGQCCDERRDRNVCTCGKDARDALLRDALRALGHDE